MFRITAQEKERATCFTLDGQLKDSDIEEVRRALSSAAGQLELSLGGLESCSEGMVCELRRWLDAGARLRSATPFLRMKLTMKSVAAQPLTSTHTTLKR